MNIKKKRVLKRSAKAAIRKSKNGGFTNGFMRTLLKESKNEFASLMDEETQSTTTEYIDTGSLALNGLLTGDITEGIPNNKTIVFAGMEGCGKTYLVLECVKNAIDAGYIVCYFDSENAVDKDMLTERGIDVKKVMYFPVATVEEVRDQIVTIVNEYNNTKENKPKVMLILDSLGNLSTTKEIADIEGGKSKQDMTRARGIKSIFRVLSNKLARAKIPFLITNHVYEVVGSFFPQKAQSGGSGPKYAASIIITITKSKAKDKAGNVCGIYMKCKTYKNRFCKPETSVKIYLDFAIGLNKYYGLQEFGDPLLSKATRGWTLHGKAISDKQLWSLEWDEELLKHINENVKNKIAFGNKNVVSMDQIVEDEKETK